MPTACPACGRPNSDQATRCLYCTEPFEAPRAETAGTERPLEAEAPASNWHLIILAPPAVGDSVEEKVSAFAEVMGWTLYDARLALQTKRHRLLRKVERAEKALELERKLKAIGIDSVVLAQAEVEGLTVTAVRWLRLGEESMELGLEDRDVRRIAYPDLLLLVRGEIARERHQESRMATPKGSSLPLTPGIRLHLYESEAQVAAELDAEQFDWGGSGVGQSTSTALNFKRLVDVILHRAPRARLDRGFDFEPVVFSRSGAVSGVDSMLDGSRTREGVMYDNQAQFRFYARWRYLAARAERSGGRDRG